MPPKRARRSSRKKAAAAAAAAEDSATEEGLSATDIDSDEEDHTSKKKKVKDTSSKAKNIVSWEWGRGDKSWVPYDKGDSDKLEKAFATKAKSLISSDFSFARSTKYQFDFVKMSQFNPDTKKRRPIRRIATTVTRRSSDDSGYAALVRTHSTTWKAKAASKRKAADHDDDSDDNDGKVLKKRKGAKAASKGAGSLGDLPPKWSAHAIKAQAALGAQSCRSTKKPYNYGPSVSKDVHGSACFDRMLENEKRLCGEWAVFYHSYSLAALLYEVQASVAAVLFRFKSTFASLPRLLVKPFEEIGDADALMKEFPKMSGRDHNPKFRAVGICATTNLLAPDMEAPPTNVFLSGYSCSDLSFMGVLEQLLQSCGVKKNVKKLAKEIVALSEKHGLDVSQFGGKHCASGRPGHLLQIFVQRNLVDKFVYAALPYGVIDKPRQPIGKTLAGSKLIQGQVRIVCHPSLFMRANLTRMFVYSADPTFHKNREAFQEELTGLLQPILGDDDTRVEAATGVFGGSLPNWFESTSQIKKAKVANKFK